MSKRSLEQKRKQTSKKNASRSSGKKPSSAVKHKPRSTRSKQGTQHSERSNRIFYTAIAAIIITGAISWFLLQEEDTESGGLAIVWMEDYDDGMQNASEAQRPAMIYFHTEWCTYCEQMDNDTFTVERIVIKSAQFTPIVVDGDHQEDLVEQYNVDGYPTVVFVDEDENELYRAGGYRGPDQFYDDMKQALANA